MAFCKNCGKEIDDNAVVCPHCGVPQKDELTTGTVDNGGFLWGLLGCCVPIVGLILFLVWKDTKPKTSKAAGIGALVGVICVVIYYIVMVVIGVGLGVAGM
ncbi:MAG: zinc ribbon domain-containing protein [Firmicutes bacterium]|nr:zinc ribbon domain-containing protein [Bacillota bacterium]